MVILGCILACATPQPTHNPSKSRSSSGQSTSDIDDDPRDLARLYVEGSDRATAAIRDAFSGKRYTLEVEDLDSGLARQIRIKDAFGAYFMIMISPALSDDAEDEIIDVYTTAFKIQAREVGAYSKMGVLVEVQEGESHLEDGTYPARIAKINKAGYSLVVFHVITPPGVASYQRDVFFALVSGLTTSPEAIAMPAPPADEVKRVIAAVETQSLGVEFELDAEDIVELHRAGLSPDVISRAITMSTAIEFDKASIERLERAGVPASVIDRAIAVRAQQEEEPAAQKPSPDAAATKSSSLSTREQLSFLSYLREQALISEEVYRRESSKVRRGDKQTGEELARIKEELLFLDRALSANILTREEHRRKAAKLVEDL